MIDASSADEADDVEFMAVSLEEGENNECEDQQESELLRLASRKNKTSTSIKMTKKVRSNSKRDKECLNESEDDDREGSEGIDEGFLQVASAKGHTASLTSNV